MLDKPILTHICNVHDLCLDKRFDVKGLKQKLEAVCNSDLDIK